MLNLGETLALILFIYIYDKILSLIPFILIGAVTSDLD